MVRRKDFWPRFYNVVLGMIFSVRSYTFFLHILFGLFSPFSNRTFGQLILGELRQNQKHFMRNILFTCIYDLFMACVSPGASGAWHLPKFWTSTLAPAVFQVLNTKGCLSLFNYFIDMSPTLMSTFYSKKPPFFLQKHVFSTKIWLNRVGLMSIK